VIYSNPAKQRVEDGRRDFIAEAKRLQKVGTEHNNIVKVNEIFEANNTAYYVMEYLKGESLRSYVKRKGHLTEAEMIPIISQIISAVGYLHKHNMTHLDIKPDNIMLTSNEHDSLRAVLIDFGLSKHYGKDGRPTSSIRILGCSDGYAPTEQYAGITTFSPTADIYALGATIAFCLLGKDPVKSTEIRLQSVCDSLKERASSITKDALVHAMRSNRNERTQNIQSLMKDLHIEEFKNESRKGGANVTEPIKLKSDNDWKSKIRKFFISFTVRKTDPMIKEDSIPSFDEHEDMHDFFKEKDVRPIITGPPYKDDYLPPLSSSYTGKILWWDKRYNMYLWQTQGMTETAFRNVEHMHVDYNLRDSFIAQKGNEFIEEFLNKCSISFHEEYPIGHADKMEETHYMPQNTGELLSLYSSDNIVILLPNDEIEFMEALKLQYKLRQERHVVCRICNPAVLYTYGSIERANEDYSRFFSEDHIDGDTLSVAYDKYICKAEVGGGIVEILSLEGNNFSGGQVTSNSLLFLGGISLILMKISESDCTPVLLDIIEYPISIVLKMKKGKAVRNVYEICDAESIPARKSLEIQSDLLFEYDVYLKIGDVEVAIDSIRHKLAALDTRMDDTVVKLMLDIDADKCIKLIFCMGSESFSINLGEHLSKYNPMILNN
jgi:serine/threonine protein kinase